MRIRRRIQPNSFSIMLKGLNDQVLNWQRLDKPMEHNREPRTDINIWHLDMSDLALQISGKN